jgi:anthranilate synthase component 1
MEALVERLSLPVPRSPKRAAGKAPEISSWLDRARYKEKVLRAKEHIACGDVIQVVVSQRFEAETCVDPFVLYRAIRAINPSPYLFFLRMGDFSLIGSSPEVMVRVEEGQVTVRPIAGTRPRGADEEQDRRLEQDLRSDPKEKAEHIMLVDLGRNDVGRVAEIGSVRVTECMAVERYSHVMHLVSNVTGRLRAGLDAFDALRATFPAGTLTGAPKIRAMEIIHDLEDVGRGFYGGAVGYIGLTGNLDTCIAIRTMMAKNGKVFFQTGAGIVADSDPDREHQECLDKAMGLVKALEMAEEGF